MLAALVTAALALPARGEPEIEVVLTNLDIPWSLVVVPDGRIFFTERPGRVRAIRDGRLEARPYHVVPDVAANAEGGLLGIALHPRFQRNGYVYLYYTYPYGAGYFNRVIRLVDRGRGLAFDRVIADRIPGWPYHNGGRIAFGPDGMLYVGTGYGPWPDLAQDRRSLGGKILRLNDDGTIPPDNPFPGSPVYSEGHRNVQGLAWHPATGRLYATEHGPTGEGGLCCRDELNLIEPGGNYGWPIVAGTAGDPRFIDPLLSSGAETSWAPSGMAFISEGAWAGSLVFAALRGRHLRRVLLDASGTRVVGEERVLSWRWGRLRDVVVAPDGSLYVLTSNRDGRGFAVAGDDRILRVTPPVEASR